MKKLFVLLAAIFAMSNFAMAQGYDYSFLAKLNGKSTSSGIIRYLKANYEQELYLKEIFTLSSKKYDAAIKDGNISDADARKILGFNLANVKNILTEDQYRKYLYVLNATVNNSNEIKLIASK